MTDHVQVSREDARILLDLAVQMDNACSGWMDSDDVAALRRLAVAAGVDPATCTPTEYRADFPHAYVHGESSDLNHWRRNVLRISREGSGRLTEAHNIQVRTPETDAEVVARLGYDPRERCKAGPYRRPCGRLMLDSMHEVQS